MEVSTSFLCDKDYKKLINELNNTNTDYIHFDVMDGKFVENKNLPITELVNLINICKKKKDVHLMVKNPEKYIRALSLCNIDYLTIHYEIKDYYKYIEQIKSLGFKVGLAINPETKIEDIKLVLKDVNLVLIMSVHPGKSGQVFIEETNDKINELSKYIKENNLNTKISVDGGINENSLPLVTNSNICVSASYILSNYDNINIIKKM